MACAQSFAQWQQATIEITCHDHSIIACSRHIHMMLFFAHIPFKVNCAFQCNASRVVATTSPSFCNKPHQSHSFCEGFTQHDLHILVTAPFCCDQKARAACVQRFALLQQATLEIMCHDYSIIACLRHTHVVVFFAHIPFVVNRAFQRNTSRVIATVVSTAYCCLMVHL